MYVQYMLAASVSKVNEACKPLLVSLLVETESGCGPLSWSEPLMRDVTFPINSKQVSYNHYTHCK